VSLTFEVPFYYGHCGDCYVGRPKQVEWVDDPEEARIVAEAKAGLPAMRERFNRSERNRRRRKRYRMQKS
jgi:hypothetical protein